MDYPPLYPKISALQRLQTAYSPRKMAVVTNLQLQIENIRDGLANTNGRIDFLYEQADLLSENKAKIIVTVKDSRGNPGVNVIITGLTTRDGNTPVRTNSTGVALGYVTAGSRTLSISKYADIVDTNISDTYLAGKVYEPTITITRRNFLLCTASRDILFSDACTYASFTLCGAGGGGAGVVYPNGTKYSNRVLGGGGGGGYTNNGGLTPSSTTAYYLYVGSGGNGGTKAVAQSEWANINGKTGGSTTFQNVSASGGNGGGGANSETTWKNAQPGGTGNGNGGEGDAGYVGGGNGSNGTGYLYASSTTTMSCGGGGGGGSKLNPGSYQQGQPQDYAKMKGGSPNGGAGGYMYCADYETDSVWSAMNSANGIQPGGGGGGGHNNYSYGGSASGGKGGAGAASFRLTLKYPV